MSKYYYTAVTRRPLHSSPDQTKPVAEVAFEAEDPHSATSFILDALDALGVPRSDSSTRTEFSDIVRLDSLPFGLEHHKPAWSNETVRVWLIENA